MKEKLQKRLKPWAEIRWDPPNKYERRGRSVYYDVPGDTGPPPKINEIEIVVGEGIHFYSDGGENLIYFYPKQIPHLQAALRTWNRRAGSKGGGR